VAGEEVADDVVVVRESARARIVTVGGLRPVRRDEVVARAAVAGECVDRDRPETLRGQGLAVDDATVLAGLGAAALPELPFAQASKRLKIGITTLIWGAVPRWIVILVVSRDIMIVTAVIVSWLFDKPVEMKPSMVSKLNTVAQVAFAALVLASLGFNFKPAPYDSIMMGFVTVFTLVSVSLYLVEWVRHMSTIDAH